MAIGTVIRLGLESAVQRFRDITSIPYFIYNEELSGIYGSAVRAELSELIKYYDIYDQGTEFTTEGSNGDYVSSQLRYKTIHTLIDKEARFLFAKKPDFWIDIDIDKEMSESQKTELKSQQTILQNYVDKVLQSNHISSKLLKAAKDCFIGKRIALFINFNDKGCKITFSPSLEFIFETDPEDPDVLTKVVTFYSTVDSSERTEQRIYKKKYYMAEDGKCHIIEELYDGLGNVVEEITPDTETLFTYIPAFVIINDGLSGDIQGVSEVAQLMAYEENYSRMANADIDAERKGMNPVTWTLDMNPRTTQNLSRAAGSHWDLASDDQSSAEGRAGSIGVLSTPMEYSGALTTTLDRIKNTMYEQLDMPNISPEALKGVVSSGKTLKAIYWGLIVRCEEKMLVWRPILESMVRTIIDGGLLYPEFCTQYTTEPLPEIEYSVRVDNQYPLPEDEAEEKQVDLAEVQAQTMSKKAYMVKWRGLTDDEAMEELQQIALERQLLEDSFMPSPTTQSGATEGPGGAQGNEAQTSANEEGNPMPEGV